MLVVRVCGVLLACAQAVGVYKQTVSVGANCESSSALGTVTRPVTHGAVPRVGVRFVRDEKMALWGSASVISMGDSPKVPFFQDVLEFGTRRQLELFTIIGKIAIIQDVLEFGTHVQLHVPAQYSCTQQYSCTCLLLSIVQHA